MMMLKFVLLACQIGRWRRVIDRNKIVEKENTQAVDRGVVVSR